MAIYYLTKQLKLIESDIIYLDSLDIVHRYLSQAEQIGCDTETTGFDPYTCKLLSLQVGDKYNQFVINCEEFDIAELKPYFEDKSKVFIFQNAKFDLRFLLHKNINVAVVMDTFLAELVLTTGFEDSGRELGLDSLTSKYCNKTLNKAIRGVIHKEGLTDRVIHYAAEDVVYLLQILEKQLEKISKYKLEKIYELECRVTKVFAKMEYTGVLLNTEEWSEIAAITAKNSKELIDNLDDELLKQEKLNSKLGRYIENQIDLFGNAAKTRVNWSSPTQKKKILEDCGLDMKDGVGDRELQRSKRKNKLVPLFIDYSKQAKLNSAFGTKFLKFVNPVTKRVHCNIWPIVSTGRISVSNPNLNQIPSKGELATKIRACFIPKEGYKIVGGDFSGMELRIIAEFSKDPLWVDAFNNGEDLHSVLCAKTFDIDVKDVKSPFPQKPDLTYRDIQKTINFGLAYGMSEFKLSDTMGISISEAKAIIDKFFAVVPQVKQFLEACASFARNNGYIKTPKPFNRIRWFPKWEQAYNSRNSFELGSIERAGKNTPIQGCNGDIIKIALIKVQQYIDNNSFPASIILAVYDEIQCEVREDKAEEFKHILDRIMIEAAEVVIKTVPVVVDSSINDCWKK